MSTIYRKDGIFQYRYTQDGKTFWKSLKCRDRKIAEILKTRLDHDLEKVSARIPIGVKLRPSWTQKNPAHSWSLE